jgi:hypothetical protein
MARLDLRLFIRATPERIWEIISDLPGQAEWMVDVRKLEVTSEVRSGTGAVIEVTSELFGLPLVKDVMEITTWQPPHRYDVAHRGQFSGSGAFILEAVSGGTVFTWIEEFKPPLGPLGELGFRFLVGPHLVRVFSRSQQNVRRLAEGQPSSASAESA